MRRSTAAERRWLWYVAIFAVVAIAIEGIVLAGRNDTPPPGTQPVVLGAGNVTAHHMKLKSWEIYYDRAQTSPDGTLVDIDGIHKGTYFKKGKAEFTLTAQHVSANTVSYDFTATGKVHIEQKNGTIPRTFETDLVVWTNSTQTLTLSHRSLLTTGEGKLTIDNASINVRTGNIKLGPINGSVHV